jgi:hypothetical protein
LPRYRLVRRGSVIFLPFCKGYKIAQFAAIKEYILLCKFKDSETNRFLVSKLRQVKSMEELFVMFVVILLLDLKIKFWKVSPSSLLPALLFGFVS